MEPELDDLRPAPHLAPTETAASTPTESAKPASATPPRPDSAHVAPQRLPVRPIDEADILDDEVEIPFVPMRPGPTLRVRLIPTGRIEVRPVADDDVIYNTPDEIPEPQGADDR